MRRLDGKPPAKRTFRPIGFTKKLHRATLEELEALANRISGEIRYRHNFERRPQQDHKASA